MKVVELFRQLSYGELSNLSVSNSGSGEIQQEKWPQLIQYANDALMALYSRFVLSEKHVLLEQVAHITNYHLRPKYAESSSSTAEWPYIKDLPEEPFIGDVIRILRVQSVEGWPYPLNDAGRADSLYTPQPHILQVPRPQAGEPLSIVYQAQHRILDDRETGPDNILDQIIDLPHYLENALKLFIAYKVFGHMNGQENSAKSIEFLAAYEASCQDIERRDLVNQTSHTTHSKLEQRGFV